jgi:AcrR family transcriptional regulator
VSTSKRKKTAQPESRAYHHGNLKEALLKAALALVESGAERGLSLRTLAARAGVSSGAPYRHFADGAALRAAVAAVGFERLLESIVKVRPSGKHASRLSGMALAYLTFAEHNPGLYRLMFTENQLANRFDAAFAQSSTAAFLALQDAVSSHLARAEDDAKLLATTIWASLHGLAMLSFERLIPAGGPIDETQARKISASAAQLLIASLFKSPV